MGTNFYFMSKNKKLMQNNFADNHDLYTLNEEYVIVDEPYLGYQIHLNKLSCGWRPLFQKHKAFETFTQLEDFYENHQADLEIYDEYGRLFAWEEYYEHIIDHSRQKKVPLKWVYEVNERFKSFGENHATLHFIECEEKDAEMYIPIEHKIYQQTEKEAIERLRVPRRYDFELRLRYWNDPDYPFDWTEGAFC